MDRRSFLKGALTGAAALSGLASLAPGSALGAEEEHAMEAVLKLSSQEWLVPGDDLRTKAQKLREWGATGVELGGGGLAGRVDEVTKALEGTEVNVSAICAGYDGWLISPDEAVRRQAVDSMKEIMTAAGAMGSTGLICVPAFNHHDQLQPKEAREVLLDLLPELGDHAVAQNTRLLLEPLNRGEAFFLRMLADAASMCRDAGHPGVAMMGDFYHMRIEETSDLGAFLSAGDYLHHVHLASRARNLPGQDERSFVDGFRGLKMIGYSDFCSLECSIQGDAEVEIPKSFRFLEEQWAAAEI